MKHLTRLGRNIVLFSIVLLVVACVTLKFDQTEYNDLSKLKTTALLLMDKAVESSTSHTTEIKDLRDQLKATHDYAAKRSKDSQITKNLANLGNPEDRLLVWFLDSWEKKGTLAEPDIESTKSNVSQILNILIDEENSFQH